MGMAMVFTFSFGLKNYVSGCSGTRQEVASFEKWGWAGPVLAGTA
jgi:hypothetical protein